MNNIHKGTEESFIQAILRTIAQEESALEKHRVIS